MRPLRDLRVLEFSHHLAGPAVGMILADLGAEVIKVARPGLQPSSLDAVLDRGKRVVTLDLKAEKDRARARTLARGADVVIENFRPGVMKRLGFDYAAISARNPRIVYCSISAFGQQGEQRAGLWPVLALNGGDRTLEQLLRQGIGIHRHADLDRRPKLQRRLRGRA